MNNDILKRAIDLVKVELKSQGFHARGAVFSKAVGGNNVLVSVQKSVSATRAESKVTLNFGIYSARVGQSLGNPPSASRDIWQAHWQTRIHHGGHETWLHVKGTDSPESVAERLLVEIRRELPKVLDAATDEALRDLWLSGVSPGATNVQRLLFLAVLLKALGPAEELDRVVVEVRELARGQAYETMVESRLAAVGVARKNV